MVNSTFSSRTHKATATGRFFPLAIVAAGQLLIADPASARQSRLAAPAAEQPPVLATEPARSTRPAPALPVTPQPKAITALDLANLRDIDALSVSPDGRNVVFLQRRGDPGTNTYEQHWVIMSVVTGVSRVLAEAGDPILRSTYGFINGVLESPRPVWSPDGQTVYYQRKRGGRVELWRSETVNRDTPARKISDLVGDVEEITAAGDALLVKVGPDPALTAVALKDEERNGFLLDKRFFPLYSTKPVRPLDLEKNPTDNNISAPVTDALKRWISIDFRTGSIEPTSAPTDGSETSLSATARGAISTGPLGRKAWFDARDPRRQGELAPVTVTAVTAPGSSAIACEHTECTGNYMRAIFWSGNEVVFARREGTNFTTTTLYAWNTLNRSLRKVFTTATEYSDWACGQNERELICLTQDLLRPARLVAIDLKSGRQRTLVEPNPELVTLASSSYVVTRVEAVSSQGVATFGYLSKRADMVDAALPLVVVTYRCRGFQRGGVGDEYPILPLASQGFAVLCFDVPGSDVKRLAVEQLGPYEDELRGVGDPEKKRVQAALDALVKKLVELGDADPKRLAVTGLSFGAETTNYALFNTANLTAAIASSAAMTPAGVFLSGPNWRGWDRWGGLVDPYGDRWRALSVTFNTGHVRAPMLLNLADREMLVATEVQTALERAGRTIETFIYPDEYHIKWQPAHRLAVYNRNIDWLNFWLRGEESGLTGDMAQYTRWRSMRDSQCRLFGPNGSQRSTRAIGHEAMADDELVPWYCVSGPTAARDLAK